MRLPSLSTMGVQDAKGCHVDRLTSVRHLKKRKVSRPSKHFEEGSQDLEG